MTIAECADSILSRLKSIALMEEKTQGESSEPPTPIADKNDKRPDFRRSSSNKLTRQQKKEGMLISHTGQCCYILMFVQMKISWSCPLVISSTAEAPLRSSRTLFLPCPLPPDSPAPLEALDGGCSLPLTLMLLTQQSPW